MTIPVTLNRWVKEFRNYASITAPGIACTTSRAHTLIILLASGDKRTQAKDIATAIQLANGL